MPDDFNAMDQIYTVNQINCEFNSFVPNTPFPHPLKTFNLFVSNVPFLYPLETSKNLKVF